LCFVINNTYQQVVLIFIETSKKQLFITM